ncbi:2-amino-4-hydroxy-6-hydroxymethyldihydropteridinediphosphokinase [soil metagenome]
MMRYVYLLCGSNMGNRQEYLAKAISLIHDRIGDVEKVSAIYESDAWGEEVQDDFLNQAVMVKSSLQAEALLVELKKIEAILGRTESFRWGPRIIDVDILLIDTLVYFTDHLQVPHVSLAERRFALMPLAEIAADLVHPVSGHTIQELLDRCEDQGSVRLKTSNAA